MTRPEDERDDELGTALRELPVPEHEPGFHGRLHAALEHERGRSHPSSEPARRWWSAPSLVRPALVACALALALTTAVSLLDDQSPLRVGPDRASAAEIVAKARDALATARSLSGVMLVRDRFNADEPVRRARLRFALTARGDLRILDDPDVGDVYFDARSARQVTLNASGSGDTIVERGLAYGAPDPGPFERALQGQLAAVARSLAAAGDASVTERDAGGRPAWVLTTATEVNKLGYTGDRLEIGVDRETNLPLFVRETFRGRLVREVRLRGLEVNPALSRADFAPRLPAGPETVRIDYGFRSLSLPRAAALPGFAVLVPQTLPSGFRRAQTRVAETAQPTGSEGLNPPSRDVVSTAYRRGLDRVVVSTRRRVGREAWSDPVAAGEGFRVVEERVRIVRGALAGETARIVVTPRVVPHVWILTHDLVVTISGPLSRDELVEAAESFARVR